MEGLLEKWWQRDVNHLRGWGGLLVRIWIGESSRGERVPIPSLLGDHEAQSRVTAHHLLETAGSEAAPDTRKSVRMGQRTPVYRFWAAFSLAEL